MSDFGKVGTLAELKVQPGDVVELVKAGDDQWAYPKNGERTKITDYGWFGIGLEAFRTVTGKFLLISRATPTPETWTEWQDYDKHYDHDKDHQVQRINGVNQFRYPVPKQPVVETVELYSDDGRCWHSANFTTDTHRITFDVIDGAPDCGSIRMEAL